MLRTYIFQLVLCDFRFLFNVYSEDISFKFHNYIFASTPAKKCLLNANFNTVVCE